MPNDDRPSVADTCAALGSFLPDTIDTPRTAEQRAHVESWIRQLEQVRDDAAPETAESVGELIEALDFYTSAVDPEFGRDMVDDARTALRNLCG